MCLVYTCILCVFFFFFFFQAEDGIRDHCVTGVQTCALPILVSREMYRASARCVNIQWTAMTDQKRPYRMKRRAELEEGTRRSEERRVGKECRSGGARDHEKKKKDKEDNEEKRKEEKRGWTEA